MISVEIIKVHVGQILPCRWVTGNKELIIGGLKLYSHGQESSREKCTLAACGSLILVANTMPVNHAVTNIVNERSVSFLRSIERLCG